MRRRRAIGTSIYHSAMVPNPPPWQKSQSCTDTRYMSGVGAQDQSAEFRPETAVGSQSDAFTLFQSLNNRGLAVAGEIAIRQRQEACFLASRVWRERCLIFT